MKSSHKKYLELEKKLFELIQIGDTEKIESILEQMQKLKL